MCVQNLIELISNPFILREWHAVEPAGTLIQLARSWADRYFVTLLTRSLWNLTSWPNKCGWSSQFCYLSRLRVAGPKRLYTVESNILYLLPKRLACSWAVLYAALTRCWVVWIQFIQSTASVIERSFLSYTRFANSTYTSPTNTQVARLCTVCFFCIKHSQFIKGSFCKPLSKYDPFTSVGTCERI